MSAGSRNPAIFAGLLGAAGLLPTQAMALPLEDFIASSAAPYIQFAFGCVAGAALSTAAHIAISAMNEPKAKKASVAQETSQSEESVVEEAPTPAHADASSEEKRTQRPVAASKAPARHMAAREWEASGVIRVQKVSEELEPASKSEVPDTKAEAPAPQAETPAPEAEAPAPAKKSPAHIATDYSDIAENYVNRKSARERMAKRSMGVAGVLATRLGANPFEGLPIIERADGTVGDVGTSWWQRAFSSSIRRIEDIPEETAKAEAESMPSQATSALHFEKDVEESRRADYISKKVAEVNVGVYPEHRTVEELEREDVWEQALKAMDERLTSQASPVFRDAIGTIETIDEPDGLEGSTGFIPFRMHANHPEVVDMNSYVDYLIDDEFSQNPSPIARRTSRDYLTVIQGGGHKAQAEVEDKPYKPKHFAPKHMPLAREA